jgi:hypothetical protein
MKRKFFAAIFVLLAVFILSSCIKITSPGTDVTSEPAVTIIYVSNTEVPTPETNVGVQPTRALPTYEPPTQIPPTPVPTTIPVVESSPYYTEEFDAVPDNWYYEIMRGNEDKADITVDKGVLTFDINDYHTYAYVFYEDWTYEDVYLETSAKNRGYNDNNISLICRYSDEGFYEVSIRSDGLYQMWVYTPDYGYKELYDGGSRRINTGQLRNVFSMSCIGNEISLYVNGTPERTITDNRYELPEGLVGVGVSALETIPVKVDIDYVTIDEP